MSTNTKQLAVGDEVECSYKGCKGSIFIVARIHQNDSCYSRVSIVAHLKGYPEREIKDGLHIDGINYGIDSSWFKKI